MANIQNDPHHRSTGPIKPKTEPLSTKTKSKAGSDEPKAPKQKKDQMEIGRSADRAKAYEPGKAKAKEEDKNFLQKINDAVLDPLGKADTGKGLYVRYLVDTLEQAGNKIGKALAAVEQFAPVKMLGKALPVLGLIPTAFDIKAAIDDNKDPKTSKNDKSLSTAKAIFSSISSATGIAAVATGATGVGAPVALALGGVSLIFSVAAWATDLGKDKK